MANLRLIKRRIKSVGGIRQITRAMEMVSATKLKKALDRVEHARLYFENMDKIVADLTRSIVPDDENLVHPLMQENPPGNDVLIVAIGSDKGLCASFNSNIIRQTWKFFNSEIADNIKRRFEPSPGDLDINLSAPKGETITFKGRVDSRGIVNPSTSDNPVIGQAGHYSGKVSYKPSEGSEQTSELNFEIIDEASGSITKHYWSFTDGINFPFKGSLKLTYILNEMNITSKKLLLIPVGKKINDTFSRIKNPAIRLLEPELNIDQNLPVPELNRLTHHLTDIFVNGKVSRVLILYTEYINPIKQKPKLEQFLPLVKTNAETEQKQTAHDYIFEPSAEELFMKLIPAYARNEVFKTLVHSFTSEHSTRMIAMRNATDNATELIDTLTLKRNKARQAAITKELSEIVGGAEALKG